jgi:hypothetical protein
LILLCATKDFNEIKMKKIFFSVLCSFILVKGFAQISLTAADIGSVGDQIIEDGLIWNAAVPPAGASQNYNFQGMDPENTLDTINFLNPAATPFATNFTAANLAQVGAGSFTYFNKSSTSFKANGFAFSIPPIPGIPFSSAPFSLTPPITVLNFPATFGQSLTAQATSNRFEFNYDTTLGIFNITKIGVTATVRDTSNIDGYGIAAFPLESIPVLRNLRRQRVSFRIQAFASISIFPPSWIDLPANLIPGGGIPDIYSRDLLFWANGKKAPIATLNLDSLGNIASARVRSELLISSRSMLSSRPSFEFIPYPNPNSGELFWNSEKSPESIEIFSMFGKKIKTFKVQGKLNETALHELQNGTYLIRAFDQEGNFGQKKLIINK